MLHKSSTLEWREYIKSKYRKKKLQNIIKSINQREYKKEKHANIKGRESQDVRLRYGTYTL